MNRPAAGRLAATVSNIAAVTRFVKAAPPSSYFVAAAVFHYLGPSFAVLLFARVQVLGVALLRIASAAIIFTAPPRP